MIIIFSYIHVIWSESNRPLFCSKRHVVRVFIRPPKYGSTSTSNYQQHIAYIPTGTIMNRNCRFTSQFRDFKPYIRPPFVRFRVFGIEYRTSDSGPTVRTRCWNNFGFVEWNYRTGVRFSADRDHDSESCSDNSGRVYPKYDKSAKVTRVRCTFRRAHLNGRLALTAGAKFRNWYLTF